MAERKRKRNTKPNSAQLVTTGTTMRIQSPKSNRRPKPSVTKTVAQEVNPVGGFVDFLREYTVVTLAIGFVVATQVQGLVKQLVADFVNPFTQLLFGGTALSERTYTWHFRGQAANFAWGDLVYGVIDFLLVLVIIYIIIKVFKLDKLNKPKNK
ncbi:MAG TPA: MscL family protein [Candidatus Saccharimonadales bacterium]|nr:MscL family protein [Candidatus Saccharimonadales bacterium]